MSAFIKSMLAIAKHPIQTMLVIIILVLGYQAWHYRSVSDGLQEVIDLQVVEHDLIIQQLALSESGSSLCEAQRNELSDQIPRLAKDCKIRIESAIKSAIANMRTPDIKPAKSAKEFNEWINETIKD